MDQNTALVDRREVEQLEANNQRLAEALHDAKTGLRTSSLPLYGGPVAPTTEPVGALIADELADELGFKGWW